jgi:hypothetical protein
VKRLSDDCQHHYDSDCNRDRRDEGETGPINPLHSFSGVPKVEDFSNILRCFFGQGGIVRRVGSGYPAGSAVERLLYCATCAGTAMFAGMRGSGCASPAIWLSGITPAHASSE